MADEIGNNSGGIKIEIILDDGSVVKGFAKVKSEGEKTAKDVEKSFNSKNLFGTDKLIDFNGLLGETKSLTQDVMGRFGRLGLIAGGVGAAIFGVKAAFDAALDGEKIIQINNQFDTLAKNAGVNGLLLRGALENAAAGFADMESILQVANTALGEMGANAQKLPEILKVARAASIQFGGTVEENFEKLNQAILSGNTKVLKSIGLFVDGTKAVKDFARQNGVAADLISKAGEQQAVLNAILEKSKTVYAGVNIDQGNLTTKTQALRVSIGELGDSFATISESTFGEFFQGLAAYAKLAADALADVGPQSLTSLKAVDEQIVLTRSRLKELNEEAAGARQGLSGFVDKALGGFLSEGTQKEMDEAAARLRELIAKREELEKAGNKKSTAGQNIIDEDKLRALQLENQKKFDAEMLKLVDETQKQRLAFKLIGATQEQALQLKLEEDERRHTNELLRIQKEYEGKSGISQMEYHDLVAKENERFEASQQAIRAENAKNQYNFEVEKQKTAVAVAQAAQNAILQVSSAALQRLGAQLVEGGKAWSDFRSVVLNILGDFAIQVGGLILSMGLGIQALSVSLATFNAAGAIAAGAALIVLGGALKALAGGPKAAVGVTGAADTGIGGGIGFQPGQGTEIVDPNEQRQPETQVQVIVQGDILDSDETGGRIINLINDAFDKKGVKIRKGAMA